MLFCDLGGGSLDGGDPASPRCLGPPRSTPAGCGAAHGPRHSAYSLLLSSVIPLLGFSLSSFLGYGFARLFRLEAEILVCCYFALQGPTPVSIFAGSVSLSLSLFSCYSVVFLVADVAFLFFFSPGAGETQTREWFVFPLVSLRPGHAHRLRPVRLHLQLPLGHRPRLFLFFSLSFRLWWSVQAVVGLILSLSLSLSLSWRCSCAACMLRLLRERGGGLPDGAPNYYYDGLCRFGHEHGAVSRTVRPEQPMLPPLPPAAL